MAYPDPIFIVKDLRIPDELCFILYWDYRESGWVYEHPLDKEKPSITQECPCDWQKYGWTLDLNFSEIPCRPCGECDAPIWYDYLCSNCRNKT